MEGESDPVQVQSQLTYRYVYEGVSHRYVFDPHATLPVYAEDLQALLAKKTRGGGCCGYRAPEGIPFFLEV